MGIEAKKVECGYWPSSPAQYPKMKEVFMTMNPDLPQRQGLYDPSFEHDSCGVNFIANLKGQKSHKIVSSAIGALCQLQHRGALGSEENTGDGAGILIQVPDKFLSLIHI